MATSDISMILPRVLIVSRRTVRKKKFVDFVGSFSLSLNTPFVSFFLLVFGLNWLTDLKPTYKCSPKEKVITNTHP